MLCLNCQWDVDGGPTSGIDADVGAYTAYRTLGSPSGQFCTPGTNQSFSSDIQSAVCNEGIKIADFLYNLYWDAGSWFYEFTMDAALKDKAASNNNMYNHCNSTTSTTSTASSLSTSTTSAPSQTTTAASPGSAQNSNVPTIVGAVIGGIAVLVFAAAISLCWRRHLRKVASASLDVNRPHAPAMEAISPYTVSGSTSRNQSSYGYEYAHTQGHLPTSRNPLIPPPTASLATTAGENGRSSDFLWNRNSSTSALRHEDVMAVPTLDRSWSGRLPPAYENVWENPQGELSGVHVKLDSSPSHVGQGV
ncbi:hypothetical protein AZE42_08252 [Rhizopogon vesiculosus]|uniref:Uncharacterized protein n=1 Tax=Rhizopogon vesiculosus TaxID=180088 RepID=A0A1J8QPY3_9AGAM|nr:hypothetical protein AZE42_08252 [Rhizopogon vesiculosus]